MIGGDWRSYRVYGAPEQNSGYLAGYATRDRPPIRVHLGEGEIQQDWRPLELYRLSPRRRGEEHAEKNQ